MAFTPIPWLVRLRQYFNRVKLTPVTGGPAIEYDVEQIEGTVTQEGTALSPTVMGAIQQGISDCHNPAYSSPLTTTDLVTHLPSTAEKGRLDITLAGRTIANFVKNGNFPDTTGWVGVSATLSASNNTMSVTGNGASAAPQIQLPAKKLATGKKEYWKVFAVRVTSNLCSQLRCQLYAGLLNNIDITNPVQNQWYMFAVLVTGNSTTDATAYVPMYLRHAYADAATANGKVMEVQEVMGIDIDAHPSLSSLTADQINAAVPMYVDGTKSAFSSVRSVGKNLFDGQLDQGTIDLSTGANVLPVTQPYTRSKGHTRVKASTQYSIDNDSALSGLYAFYYNASMGFLSSANINTGKTFTTPANCAYVRFVYVNKIALDAKIQLELGSTATTYAPYVETSYAPATELRSLPNLVKDTLTGDGMLTRRTGTATLAGLTYNSTQTGGTNVDRIRYARPTDAVVGALTGIAVAAGFAESTGSYDDVANIGMFTTIATTGFIEFIVAKGTSRATFEASVNMSALILYQLATPIVSNIGGSVLIAEPSGTIYLEPEAGYVQPEITYSYPTNPAATNQGNSDLARVLDKNLKSHVQDPTKGGTGIESYETGDLLFASAPNVLAKLPKGAAGQTLRMNAAGTAPEYANSVLRYMAPSDEILLEMLAEVSQLGQADASLKYKIQVPHAGLYRLTGEIRASSSSGAFVQMGGAPVRAIIDEQLRVSLANPAVTTSTTYVTFTIDAAIPVAAGGVITIWVFGVNGSTTGYARNLRLRGTLQTAEAALRLL